MRKTLAALGAAAALAAAPLLSAPAQAAAPAACPAGYLCLYDDASGSGLVAMLSVASPSLGGLDNRASAYQNRTGRAWTLYDGYGFTGTCLTTNDPAFHPMPPHLDDRVSSARPGGYCAQAD